MQLRPGQTFANLRVDAEIGRGPFSAVYRATDAIIGRTVVLKVVPRTTSRAPSDGEFEGIHEARLVGNLKSAHVITLYRVHTLGDDAWVLEMEHAAGGSLEDRLGQQGSLAPRETVRILQCVASALEAAHRHGVLHRDIKPSNVLLAEDGTAQLSDFGLARRFGEEALDVRALGGASGTPLYMAPEAIMGDPASVASDLWSVGVLAYVMLTGRQPFEGRDLPSLFLALQNSDPAPLGADAPPDLASLTLRCLSRSPDDRPASATSVRETLDRIAARLESRSRRTDTAAGPGPAGREREETRLRKALDLTEAGRGTTVVVTGNAGMGKSTLLSGLESDAAQRGFCTFEASLTPVGGIRRAVVRALERLLDDEEGSQCRTPPQRDSTVTRLHELVAGAREPEHRSHEEFVFAVERTLRAVADRHPVVLVIEEARFCTEDCLHVLSDLSVRLAKSRVLLAVAYRSGEVEAAPEVGPPALRELLSHRGVVHLRLAPLDDEAMFRRLEEEVQPLTLDPEVAAALLAKAEGNPLHAVELLRHLEEVGGLVRRGGQVRPGPRWGRTPLPRRFHEVVARRLEGLDPDERSLLDAAAVEGIDFDSRAVATVAEMPLLGVLRTLQRIYRERGLVSPRPTGFRFAHPLIQEVLYEQLAPALREEIHRRLAEHLEVRSRPGVDPERLGHHWERAGLPDRAAGPLREAAREASRRGEPQRALRLAERAGVFQTETTADSNADLLRDLAACCVALESYEKGRDLTARLLVLADSLGDGALRLRATVLREELRYGEIGAGAVDVDALETAGRELPDSRERGRAYLLRGLIDRDRGDPASAGSWLDAARQLFDELGEPALTAASHNALASVARHLGRPEDAEQHFTCAAAIARAEGYRATAATSEINRAITALGRGALEGLAPTLERSIRSLALTGAGGEAARGGAVLARVHYARGDRRHAERVIERTRRVLDKRGQRSGLVHVLPVQAHQAAIRGDLDAAFVLVEEARWAAERGGSRARQVGTAALETQIACFAGDVARAREAAARGCTLAAEGLELRCRAQLAIRLAESAAYGLPADALRCAEGLIPADAEAPDLLSGCARRALFGAAALLERGNGAPRIRSMAEVYERPDLGDRQAEYSALAASLRGDAAWRDGDGASASEALRTALQSAERLGHVWLRLRTLRALGEVEPGRGHAALLAERVGQIATRVSDTAYRERLLRAWLPARSTPLS